MTRTGVMARSGRGARAGSGVDPEAVVILWRGDVPEIRNSTLFQRLRALSARYRVELVTAGDAGIAPALAAGLRVVRLPVSANGPGVWRRLWGAAGFLVLACAYAVRRSRRGDAPVLYTFHGPELVAGAAGAACGVRWVADILDLPEEQVAGPARDAWRHRRWWEWAARTLFLGMARRCLWRADVVVTVATARDTGLAPLLQRGYRIPPEKLVCVPNGADLEATLPAERPHREGFRLCYVGTIFPRGGIEAVLRAIHLLRPRIPGLQATLAGPIYRYFRQPLGALLAELSLDGEVVLPGRVDHAQVIEWIRDSDVCLCPFLPEEGNTEAMPIKVLEYLALGRAVVASDLVGVRLIIRDGENGLLVPPGDPEALASAIERLYRDAGLRERLEANARPSVSRFAWSEINTRYLRDLAARLRGLPGESTQRVRQRGRSS